MRIVSWDGHNINDGTSYSTVLKWRPRLPQVNSRLVRRTGRWPLLGGVARLGHRLTLQINIGDSNTESLLSSLCQWMDPEDETAKKLVVEDDDGGNSRYVYAICQSLQTGPANKRQEQIATLVIHNDVRWRSVTEDSEVWAITATGQTRVIANGGTDDAYPVLKIKPTSIKSGGYAHKRWMPVRWLVDEAYAKYPVDICNNGLDTAALVTAGKMQADGDDLRVLVDGVETDRWPNGINTSTTKVWVNLNFQAKAEATLATAIAASGTVDTIDLSDSSDFPSSGTVMLDNEAFTFTGKNDSLNRLTGVTRASKGTSMAAHTTSDTAWWVQRDIWILYGNSSATAPSVDDDYKPAFNLATSTNTNWDYDEFGEDDGLRAASWVHSAPDTYAEIYTANHNTNADPWPEIGWRRNVYFNPGSSRWYIQNPCGITNINFANGEKYSEGPATSEWDGKIESSTDGSSWDNEYEIPIPASLNSWESWSRSEALVAGATFAALTIQTPSISVPAWQYIEAADCTLTLDSSNTPTVNIGSEQGNYSLECTITNETTGLTISLEYIMNLNEELEVDTVAKTVIDLEDNSGQFQALTLEGGARRDWLALQPGNNTLRFDDAGTTAVTVTVEFEKRWY